MMLLKVVFAALAFISSPDFADGIIAGEYAEGGQFPYSVVILQEGEVLCGGVLVTRQHVFTACHCVGMFGKLADVTDINWEPQETAYTVNVTFNDSKWSTEPYPNSDNDDDPSKINYLWWSRVNRDISDYVDNEDYIEELKNKSNATEIRTTSSNRTRLGFGIGPRDLVSPTRSPTLYGLMASTESREGFIPYDLTQILLVAGTIWIYRFGNGQVRAPSSSFQHPSCNNDTVPWDFDFGVYQTESFILNDFLRPMTLWYYDREIMRKRFNDLIKDGATCMTVGWGATLKPYEGNELPSARNDSEKLKMTVVKLVADSLCNELLCRQPYWFCKGMTFPWSDRGIVCAAHVSRGDSCSDDDGNALICDDHVVGFANSGVDCYGGAPRFGV